MDEFTRNIIKGLSIMFLSAVALVIALSVQSDARACHDPTRPVPAVLEPSKENRANLSPLDANAEAWCEEEEPQVLTVEAEEPETEPETEAEPETEMEPETEQEESGMKYFDVPLSDRLQEHIWKTAEEFGIDPLLVYAIIEEESLFRADAVSKSNDFGLCQINAINNDWLYEHYGLTNMLDPFQNVIAGCAILKWTKGFTETDELDELLLFYGCGVGRGRQLWAQGIRRLTFGDRMIEILGKYQSGERDR